MFEEVDVGFAEEFVEGDFDVARGALFASSLGAQVRTDEGQGSRERCREQILWVNIFDEI